MIVTAEQGMRLASLGDVLLKRAHNRDGGVHAIR